jgi:Zn-finger protein
MKVKVCKKCHLLHSEYATRCVCGGELELVNLILED